MSQLTNPFDRLEDVIERIGVAESQVSRSVLTERRAIEARDTGLVQ